MVRRSNTVRIGFVAIGISLAVVILSMTPLAGNPGAQMFLLGFGILGLSSGLIILQLRFFREGDARQSKCAKGPIPIDEAPAPSEIRNQRLRTIWSNMEGARRLMKHKEEQASREERIEEKKRLGLPEKEEILYMGNRSLLYLWPVSLMSFTFIAVSTALTGAPSLICLAAGLTGLGLLAAMNRTTRYYVTNFRILVRRRSPLCGKTRWRAMQYADIGRFMVRKKFARSRLRLVGKGGEMDITGLNRTELEAVSRVLRGKITR